MSPPWTAYGLNQNPKLGPSSDKVKFLGIGNDGC
jgi:hypothetical protein